MKELEGLTGYEYRVAKRRLEQERDERERTLPLKITLMAVALFAIGFTLVRVANPEWFQNANCFESHGETHCQ